MSRSRLVQTAYAVLYDVIDSTINRRSFLRRYGDDVDRIAEVILHKVAKKVKEVTGTRYRVSTIVKRLRENAEFMETLYSAIGDALSEVPVEVYRVTPVPKVKIPKRFRTKSTGDIYTDLFTYLNRHFGKYGLIVDNIEVDEVGPETYRVLVDFLNRRTDDIVLSLDIVCRERNDKVECEVVQVHK